MRVLLRVPQAQEFVPDSSKAQLAVKTGPPNNQRPVSNWAGTGVLPAPPGFDLQFSQELFDATYYSPAGHREALS